MHMLINEAAHLRTYAEELRHLARIISLNTDKARLLMEANAADDKAYAIEQAEQAAREAFIGPPAPTPQSSIRNQYSRPARKADKNPQFPAGFRVADVVKRIGFRRLSSRS